MILFLEEWMMIVHFVVSQGIMDYATIADGLIKKLIRNIIKKPDKTCLVFYIFI